jgi:hypothetical protein
VPAEVLPGSGDPRRLGVAVASVSMAGLDLHPDALTDGWHTARAEHWRWSDGAATVVLPRMRRPAAVEIRFGADGLYWQQPDWMKPAFAARLPVA